MNHRPNPNKATPTMLSFLLLLLGIVGYLAGVAAEKYAWVFQMVCIIGITASLYVLLRWRMTWFLFSICPRDHRDMPAGYDFPAVGMADAAGCPVTGVNGAGFSAAERNPYGFMEPEQLDLVVVKGQGSRPGIMECVLGMDSLVQVWAVCRKAGVDTNLSPYRPADIRAQYPGVKLYEYTQTFQWDTAMVAIFRDGNGYAALLLDIPPESILGQYLLKQK